MRQQLKFDLCFSEVDVTVLTLKGAEFLSLFPPLVDFVDLYVAALEVGLKVSFETIAVRDKLTLIQIKETV